MAAVEGVGVDVEDFFSGGRGGGGDDGVREACADEDEIEGVGLNWRIGRSFVHCEGLNSEPKQQFTSPLGPAGVKRVSLFPSKGQLQFLSCLRHRVYIVLLFNKNLLFR